MVTGPVRGPSDRRHPAPGHPPVAWPTPPVSPQAARPGRPPVPGGQAIDGRGAARELELGVTTDVEELRGEGPGIGPATVVVGDEFSSVSCERRLGRLAAELDVPHLRGIQDDHARADLLAVVAPVDHIQERSGQVRTRVREVICR